MNVLGVPDDQLVEVYRGIGNVEPGGLILNRLGRHWSTNRRVAKSFTDGGDCGVLICGLVRRRDILTEAEAEALLAGVESPDSPEQEVTLARWTDVWITSITYLWDETEERHELSYRNRLGAA